MAKEKIIGLSRDLIIHPCETLKEVLESRNMNQKELALRTGVSEKHISTVLGGTKNISPAFAKKLEYALGINAQFWNNLQSNYDRELIEYEELQNITKEEKNVLKSLKEVLDYWVKFGIIQSALDSISLVTELRNILMISNLCDIPKIQLATVYRAQTKNNKINPYVLFAWQRMCELITQNEVVNKEVDIELLKKSIPSIKKIMFMNGNEIQKELKTIFNKCGIYFAIVPHFKGAPVQGFIKTMNNGSLVLCVTLRQKFADIFWFSLFHEIAHILNGDLNTTFLDFDSVSTEIEEKADREAANLLIDSNSYKKFIKDNVKFTNSAIEEFARTQSVKDFIVRGRLMRDEKIKWGNRLKYCWEVNNNK